VGTYAITGAASGIGGALARRLRGQRGARARDCGGPFPRREGGAAADAYLTA